MIETFLKNNSESDVIELLKKLYASNTKISEYDKIKLQEYETADYALLGIIGLILDNKARILLGKKQVYDKEIQEKCKQYPISQNDLDEIANKFLEDDFSEESEFILRKVMLEYPKKRELNN
ncbi:hypothetical protein IU405_08745 [Polaribacter sp. BAL334]|uniref:hypothetical protein n=1 Tax=Polaribacter sp. BAL334 TaxID=1708178 RepID=UPI0018D251CA|nr:hypothetical protein [Polaribacter sp. BAL334]MBG7612333.1 hypothetical protein [Polaribacter sp. BAL334]